MTMTMIYALGSNGSGQLAIGHAEDVSVPKEVLFDGLDPPSHVTQVRAGGNHTLLLADGKLYVAGNYPGSSACDDRQATNFHAKFQQVRLVDDPAFADLPIVLCAASWEASIIVQQDENGSSNRVFSIGMGNHGELGQGESLFRSVKPQIIDCFPPPGLEIRDIAACVNHVVAVLSNGDVYGWGNGRKGQLGEPKGFVYRPRKVENLDFEVERVVCGREFTCLLGGTGSQNGLFSILGSDKDNVITSAPTSLSGWKDIGAGWSSIHVLNQDGVLKSWGQNNYRQLASPELPQLSQIAVGSEHTLGLTMDGKVLAWGWGEHGNCGPESSKESSSNKFNVIASSEYLKSTARIVGIGAGCATSWVFVMISSS
ncbi:hypothetical protein K3495_g12437 [Podosphaera aphanis]|nr:hypothetical protein K3495_g12437 [Podosphaera aphanis]